MPQSSRIRVLAVLLLLPLVALPGVATAFAQDQPPQKAPAAMVRGPFAPMLLQLGGLGLSQEQRQQILGIFKAHQADVKAVGEKLRAARARWEQTGQIDIKERRALVAERQAVMKSVTDDVITVLTPEQQKKFEARRVRAAKRSGR